MQLQVLARNNLLPLAQRYRTAHKGDFGRVLVMGGDEGMGGAAILAALFSARVGAGKVALATQKEHVAPTLTLEPCLMPKAVKQRQDLLPLLKQATTIVLGPGLGHSPWSKMLFSEAMKQSHPKVIDADALGLLKQSSFKHEHQNILTPHPGEAAHLLDLTVNEVQEDRRATILALYARFKGIIILKGAGTLIYDGNTMYMCAAGNPGMASGGMGDALSGILGGLLAQGLKPIVAAQIGVLVHALAGDIAAQELGEHGLLATDLIKPMRKLLNGLL